MNNYKIRVNNEAESREAQELFFELGYGFFSAKNKAVEDFEYTGEFYFFAYGSDHDLTVSKDRNLFFAKYDFQELTPPQLRDLVVLHRNDIDDANCETEGDDQIYEDSSGKSFIFREQGWDELQRHEMRQSMWEKTKSKPQTYENEQGLISGADAKLAWANGNCVQIRPKTPSETWKDLSGKHSPDIFDQVISYDFRLKPRTVKLEIEVPAPFEPKYGDKFFYIAHTNTGFDSSICESTNIDECLAQFGAWRTEVDIKIVVEQLRKLKEHSK